MISATESKIAGVLSQEDAPFVCQSSQVLPRHGPKELRIGFRRQMKNSTSGIMAPDDAPSKINMGGNRVLLG